MTGPDGRTETTRTNLQSPVLLASGTLLADRYRIVRLLGLGGMGMVYEARDERLGLTVAVKVLRPEHANEATFQGRLHQELLAGRQISHQGVVRIHDLDRHGELSFITMDYVPGRSLSDLLKERGRLPLKRALEIETQLAAAMATAHREGVIHRDLKPSNILLDDAGDAHITDFGIARTLSSTDLTRTGDVLGTPEYLAPEQAQGQPVDHRADIYALGLIFFRMVTGESPFRGEHLGERLAERISGRARHVGEAGVKIPAYLEAIVARCLARDPEDRYASAEELVADLEAARPPSRRRWTSRRRLGAAVGLVLALCLGVAAASLRTGGPVSSSAIWSRTQETTTPQQARSRVAVLPPVLSEAASGEPFSWLPVAIAEMLSSSLGESADLRVVDHLRVVRTLQDLRLADGPLPEQELRLLAELLDAERLVVGRVWVVGEVVHVELRIVSSTNPGAPGPILRGEAAGSQDVFRLMSELSADLRRSLEAEPPIHGGRTSASAEALAAYGSGLQSLGRGDSLGALPELRRAVEEDPEFTAAWVSLARTYQSLGRRQEALDAVQRAVDQTANAAGRTGFEARAQLASLQGELEEAQELLEELVAHYPHDVSARIRLAEAYGESGRYDRAETVLRAITEEEPHHPRAWYLRAKYAILGGHARRAVDEYLVQALVIQNRLGNRQGQAEVLNALGAAHEELGELDQAEESYREAVEIRREIGDRRGTAVTLSNLATLQRVRGNLEEAQANLEESLALREDLGDQEGVAQIENQLGFLQEQQGDFPGALDHYRRALGLRQELGDRRAIAESYDNVAFAYFVLGGYDNAALHWQEALKIYRQVGHQEGEAQVLQSLGQLAMVQGSWEEALSDNLSALELARKLDLGVVKAVAHAHLGRIARFQGRYGAALSSYATARELIAGFDDLRGRTEFALFEAELRLEIGQLDRVRSELARTDEWIRTTGHHEQRAERLRLEAEVDMREDRLREAREVLGDARAEARASGGRAVELRVDLTRGRLALAAGEHQTAADLLTTVLREAERLGHAVLQTEAGAALAAAQRALGQRGAAEETVRRALEVAYDKSPMAITAHLHLVLGDLLELRGATTQAAEELTRARGQMDRLREGLDADQRAAFDRLPEVREIVQRNAA